MRDITCRDMVAMLDGYVASELPGVHTREIDGHIGGCRDCGTFLDTYRTTIALMAQLRSEDMPPDLREKLQQMVGRIGLGPTLGEC